MGTDAADGRMSLSNNVIDIHRDDQRSQEMFDEMGQCLNDLVKSPGEDRNQRAVGLAI